MRLTVKALDVVVQGKRLDVVFWNERSEGAVSNSELNISIACACD
jgi:hypothetical protein